MGYSLTRTEFNEFLGQLQNEYKIYGPTCQEGGGAFSATDLITYDQITELSDLELETKTKFSPKEIIFPIRQTMFYFTEEEIKESEIDEKKIIILLRPCDRNAIKRLDKVFLENGPEEDIYYQKLRDQVEFFVLECTEGFDSCFCVSMNCNRVTEDDYAAFLRFDEENIRCTVNNSSMETVIKNSASNINFTPQFITENKTEVSLPKNDELTNDLFEAELWEEYTRRCIGCGRCNTSCPTCSCFTVKDIVYEANNNCGERQRMWAGCHLDGFTEMAGGHKFRKEYGDRMRYKTMHKIYDFKERFGINMCVGCGRCDDVCPEYISFANCINRLNRLVKEEE